MRKSKIVIETIGEEETVSLGRAVGRKLKKGDVIGLIGELGIGKTYFVKGLADGIGISEDQYVASPTFTLINEYIGNINLYHFDLYRIQSESELRDIGYDEYFAEKGIVVIEWADKILKLLPEENLLITIRREGEDTRKLIFNGKGDRYVQLLNEIEDEHKFYFSFSKFIGKVV